MPPPTLALLSRIMLRRTTRVALPLFETLAMPRRRPALERSLHVGAAHAPRRPRPNCPDADPPGVPARVSAALDAPRPRDAPHAGAPVRSPGGTHGSAAHPGQG